MAVGNDSERVWLEHPETGGKQQFAADAADAWRAMGWVDTDPAEEPNPVLVEWPNPDEDSSSKTSRKNTKTADPDTGAKTRRSSGKNSSDEEEA